MSEPRFISVKINDKITAHVEVISEHPDDAQAHERVYLHSYLDDLITQEREALQGLKEAKQVLSRVQMLAELTVERDKRRIAIIEGQLKTRHAGDQIKDILRACDGANFLAVQLLNAAWGFPPRLNELSATDTTPSTPSSENSSTKSE